jgi:hypothetical protein
VIRHSLASDRLVRLLGILDGPSVGRGAILSGRRHYMYADPDTYLKVSEQCANNKWNVFSGLKERLSLFSSLIS